MDEDQIMDVDHINLTFGFHHETVDGTKQTYLELFGKEFLIENRFMRGYCWWLTGTAAVGTFSGLVVGVLAPPVALYVLYKRGFRGFRRFNK